MHNTVVPAVILLGIVFLMGALVGTLPYEENTRDCTIICPGNAESIEWKGSCYCKTEGNNTQL